MPTTSSSSKAGDAPAPERTPDHASQGQQQGAGQGNGGRPSFVPQHVQRQQLSGAQPPVPTRTPGGSVSSVRSSVQQTRHVPRGLGGALGRPGQQQAPAGRSMAATGGARASYTGTVAGQFTVNYPNDSWFYDSTLGSWMMLDPTYESGVMLMNEVVSLARAHGLTLYYDTDDTTGYVVDVYAF
jgi:hypothetical protein